MQLFVTQLSNEKSRYAQVYQLVVEKLTYLVKLFDFSFDNATKPDINRL